MNPTETTQEKPRIIYSGQAAVAWRCGASIADYCIVAPGVTTSSIQELHIALAHILRECVEAQCSESNVFDKQKRKHHEL